MNLYAYCSNDGVNCTDPMGREEFPPRLPEIPVEEITKRLEKIIVKGKRPIRDENDLNRRGYEIADAALDDFRRQDQDQAFMLAAELLRGLSARAQCAGITAAAAPLASISEATGVSSMLEVPTASGSATVFGGSGALGLHYDPNTNVSSLYIQGSGGMQIHNNARQFGTGGQAGFRGGGTTLGSNNLASAGLRFSAGFGKRYSAEVEITKGGVDTSVLLGVNLAGGKFAHIGVQDFGTAVMRQCPR